MRNLIKPTLLILTLLLPLSAQASEPRLLTLEQALALAGARNHDIAKAKEYGRMAQGKYQEERAAALPSFSLTGYLARSVDEAQSELAMGFIPERQDSRALSLGVSQRCSPGARWGRRSGPPRRASRPPIKGCARPNQNTARDVALAFYDTLLAHEQREIAARNLAQRERHRPRRQQAAPRPQGRLRLARAGRRGDLGLRRGLEPGGVSLLPLLRWSENRREGRPGRE